MELLFEILFQFGAELLLQIVLEIMAEIGVHSLSEPFRRRPHPVIATIGYALWGAAAGGISLVLFPRALIFSLILRKINVLVTPVAAAGLMMLIGRRRDRRGQRTVGLDRFGYAFVFALAMAIMRYVLTA